MNLICRPNIPRSPKTTKMCRTYYPVGLRTQLKVPLKSVSIQIKVVDFFSSATMEQEYRNEESFSINTEFVFLVRQNISITNLSWEIDGISSEAKIKDCKEANKLFQSAVKRGFLAGILEFENGRFLTMKIGNLNPWSVIKIRVQFVEVLAIDETNHLTLELPMPNIKQIDNIQNLSKWEEGKTSKATKVCPPSLSILVEIVSRGAITSVKSSSHQIQVEPPMNEGDLNVVLAQLEGNLSLLAKHFNLSIFIQDLARPSIHVEKHSTRNSFASMLNFVPRMDFEYEPVELVILMAFFEPLQSLNISNLQFNLRLLLHSLPFGSFFKIVTPIDQGESVPIGTEAITSASSTLDNLEWNTYDVRGGEQFSQVLVQEVESPVGAGLPIRRKNIHVLTNNDPNLKDETLDVVRKSSELLSIFVLSVESRSDDCSLETLASLGRGFCETLSDNGLTTNGRKVIGILKCILQPVYRAKVCWHKSCDLSWMSTLKGHGRWRLRQDNPLQGQWPRTIPRVFNGRKLTVFYMYGSTAPPTKDVHVHLTCERPKADFKMEFMSTSSTNTKIHQVGAFCRIKELELEFTPNTRAELVKVSETFQVLSNATSFYWMSDNQEEHVSQVQQGAPVPTAVHESGRHLAPAYRKPYWEQINVLNTPFEEVNQLEGLDYLLNFQSNDGGFAPSDDLSTFLFGKAWELDQCRADHEEAKVWATALVVWVLRIRMDKLKELWCLVEDKALKWLQSNHANADDVLAKAQNTISISAK